MHRVGQNAKLAAERLHDSLQSQAHAEHRNARVRRVLHQLRHAEIFRSSRPGRNQNHIGLNRVEHLERRARPIRHYFGAGLARVIRQRVDEAVVVIDQQQLHSRKVVIFVHARGRLRRSAAAAAPSSRKNPVAFSRVSRSSDAGSES